MDYSVRNRNTGEVKGVFIKHNRVAEPGFGGAVDYSAKHWLEDADSNRVFSTDNDLLSPSNIYVGGIVIINNEYYDVVE